jgi:hypothetical protein
MISLFAAIRGYYRLTKLRVLLRVLRWVMVRANGCLGRSEAAGPGLNGPLRHLSQTIFFDFEDHSQRYRLLTRRS